MCSARALSACQAEIANMTIQNEIQDFFWTKDCLFLFSRVCCERNAIPGNFWNGFYAELKYGAVVGN